jgi:hypothetical protein
VGGDGGYFRRNDWVPPPEVGNPDELNGYLQPCRRQDQTASWQGAPNGWRSDARRTGAPAAGDEVVRSGRDQLPDRGRTALHARADQPLLRATAAGNESQTLSQSGFDRVMT